MDISRRSFLKALGLGGAGAAGEKMSSHGTSPITQKFADTYHKVASPSPTPYRTVRRRKPPESSKVYHVPANAQESMGNSWAEKIKHAWKAAELDEIIDPGDNVAIKLHMGERNRDAYIRPNQVRAVANLIKEAGGYPFVADTLTAYFWKIATRSSIKNYKATAKTNGFTKETVGCPVIPYCDGAGDSQLEVDIDGNQLETAYVARLLGEADAYINLAHCKGHTLGMYGGAIKNAGIGGASKQGKCIDHENYVGPWETPRETEVTGECPGKDECPAYGTPVVGNCEDWCPHGAFEVTSAGLEFDESVCQEECKSTLASGCAALANYGCKAKFTNVTEPAPSFRETAANTQIRFADTATALENCFDGKAGYIGIMKDVAPECDCLNYDSRPLVPNQGVVASKDMAALDTAVLDMYKAAPYLPGSLAEQKGLKAGDEKFEPINGQSPYFQVNAVENLGYGTTNYELVEVEDSPWEYPWFLAPLYEWDYRESYETLDYPEDKDVNESGAWYYTEE
ncbi:iron-sulfur cluster-binding protein [archaeon SCG-AAA382B04]|nr:iron-sulfur cluster-binding protein [archaeon SCG-AAA382B04]